MIIRILVAAGIAAVVLSAPSSCESGGVREPDGGSKNAGGRVTNSSESVSSIDTYRSWDDGPDGKAYRLQPGDTTSGKVDTDGLCIDPGYIADLQIKSGPFTFGDRLDSKTKFCRKINDIETATVVVKKR